MWNYRLVQSKEDNTVVLAEVYYNDDGTPYGFAEAGVLEKIQMKHERFMI